MFKFLTVLCVALLAQGFCDNQTDVPDPNLSPNGVPFKVSIVLADFQLPSDNVNRVGLQGFCTAVHDGKWLLLAGRTDGMHGFQNDNTNFPFQSQNLTVFVIDPKKKTVKSRSLLDPSSELNQFQIETLSVTDAQFYQVGDNLYVIGGYGFDSSSIQFNTKSTLSVIDVPGLMKWVEKGHGSAKKHIRQASHSLLQTAGGVLSQTDPHHPFLLSFGQNFTGANTITPITTYTEQVRPFNIVDNGHNLYIQPEKQHTPDPNYRRTDINVVPIIQKVAKSYQPSFVAFSGVFTPTGGVWTVPISIKADGSSFMPSPSALTSFKQGMNNFACANAGLFSKKTNEMYTVLFGGLSYLTVQGGMIVPDFEIPFVNTVTTIRIDSKGNYEQFVMENEYPVIPSQFSNPGNPLLFGTFAQFIPAGNLSTFSNAVFSLDDLGSSPITLGYIVGGIQSTVPNTNTSSDSSSSPYIFQVILQRR